MWDFNGEKETCKNKTKAPIKVVRMAHNLTLFIHPHSPPKTINSRVFWGVKGVKEIGAGMEGRSESQKTWRSQDLLEKSSDSSFASAPWGGSRKPRSGMWFKQKLHSGRWQQRVAWGTEAQDERVYIFKASRFQQNVGRCELSERMVFKKGQNQDPHKTWEFPWPLSASCSRK